MISSVDLLAQLIQDGDNNAFLYLALFTVYGVGKGLYLRRLLLLIPASQPHSEFAAGLEISRQQFLYFI
jgi:hypothetical protein